MTVIGICFSAYHASGVVGVAASLVFVFRMLRGFELELLLPLGMLGWSAFQFTVSLGLFMRRRWTRKAFIILRIIDVLLMALGALWLVVMESMMMMEAAWPTPTSLVLDVMMLGVLLALGILFVWIVRRLRASEIVAEFEGPWFEGP